MLKRLRAGIAYANAFRCLGRGQPEAAYAGFSEFLQVVPQHALAYCNRGLALQMLQQHEQAFADCSRAIEINPRLMMPYFNRGISSKLMGEYERAVVDYEAAIVRGPKYAAAHGELGVVRTLQHEYDRAIPSLTKAIELEPKRPDYLIYRGYAQFYNGEYANAAVDLRKSISIHTDTYAMLFCFLAEARLGKKPSAQLQSDMQKLKSAAWPAPVAELFLGIISPDALLAAAPKPNDRAEAHFYIGQWHLLQDDRIAAVKALREAMRTCPVNFIERTGAVAELRHLGMAAAVA
jgi:lipoprotein NlpI